LAAYRSFHGSAPGAGTLTGENRRWPNEPGIPGVVNFFAPLPYRSPFHTRDAAEETQRAIAHLEDVILYEGRDRIAALLIEPIVGSNGVVLYPDGYLRCIREVCDRYGILLIFDEVMTGFRVARGGAQQLYGTRPDLTALGKVIGGGLPGPGGLPGQLAPLLELIGVRAVVTGTDDDLARSDAPPPADVASELSAQPGFTRAARSYGPLTSFTPTDLGPAQQLPQVRRYDLPSARGLIHLVPVKEPVVIDGSADALAGLAAFGEPPSGRALLYAGDLAPAELRAAVAGGGDVVISDSNRRRAFVDSSLEQNVGPVLSAAEDVSSDGIILDPFKRGPDFETVASFSGVQSVEAPASPERRQFPEHAAFAAIDGSPGTAWVADPTLDPGRRWLQVDFKRPLPVPFVDLLPYDDAGGAVRQVQIAGRSFTLHSGWNRLPLGLRWVGSLRVTLTVVTPPLPGEAAGAGGIAELRIPGVSASEELRTPLDAARALAEAERLGRESLAEVRATMGLLRSEKHEGIAAPVPGAGQVPRLVDQVRDAGADVTLVVDGDPAAGIRDVDIGRLGVSGGLDPHRPVARGMPDGVLQEVADDPIQPLGLILAVPGESQPFLGRPLDIWLAHTPRPRHYRRQRRAEIERPSLLRGPAGQECQALDRDFGPEDGGERLAPLPHGCRRHARHISRHCRAGSEAPG